MSMKIPRWQYWSLNLHQWWLIFPLKSTPEISNYQGPFAPESLIVQWKAPCLEKCRLINFLILLFDCYCSCRQTPTEQCGKGGQRWWRRWWRSWPAGESSRSRRITIKRKQLCAVAGSKLFVLSWWCCDWCCLRRGKMMFLTTYVARPCHCTEIVHSQKIHPPP